jgi:hypothetical protein
LIISFQQLIKMDRRRAYIFTAVLTLLIVAYLYASHKMVIYNKSGIVINEITLVSEFSSKKLSNIENGAKLTFSLFTPFNKKVRIKTQIPGHIHTSTFVLKGLLLGEQYNQVVIAENGTIRFGLSEK